MRIPTALMASLGFMLVTGPAAGQSASLPTQTLVEYCASDDVELQAFCGGYIIGTIHTLTIPSEQMPKGRFCREPDQSIRVANFADNLVLATRNNPELERLPSYLVLAKMLESAFPCDISVPATPGTEVEQDAPEEFLSLPGANPGAGDDGYGTRSNRDDR